MIPVQELETEFPSKTRGALSETAIRGLLGYNLKRAYMAFVPGNHAALAEFDLKVQSFTCLSLIEENPGLIPSELADYLRIERSNLVVILTELTKRGLIDRERSPIDRRRIALRLTEEGRSLYRAAHQALVRSEAEVLGQLSEEECEQLTRLLSRIESRQGPEAKD